MEEVLLGHADLVEAAVVSEKDALKGEIPVGFVVIKLGHNPDPKKLEADCIKLVRDGKFNFKKKVKKLKILMVLLINN